MVNSIDELIIYVQNEFKDVLGDLSDYELSIMEKSIRLPFKRLFTSPLSMTENIQSMIANLSELNYLRNRIISLRYKINVEYRSSYDKQFSILTRAGRPSKQAIDSEIHYSDAKLNKQRECIEKYDNLLEYLDNQIELIKTSIRNYENQKFHS